MKTSKSKRKPAGQHESATVIHSPQLPCNYEQILRRAQDIYRAEGGVRGMTLNDWLKAEQQLKQELEKDANNTRNYETNYENLEF